MSHFHKTFRRHPRMRRHNQIICNKQVSFPPASLQLTHLHTCSHTCGSNQLAPALPLTAHDLEGEVTDWAESKAQMTGHRPLPCLGLSFSICKRKLVPLKAQCLSVGKQDQRPKAVPGTRGTEMTRYPQVPVKCHQTPGWFEALFSPGLVTAAVPSSPPSRSSASPCGSWPVKRADPLQQLVLSWSSSDTCSRAQRPPRVNEVPPSTRQSTEEACSVQLKATAEVSLRPSQRAAAGPGLAHPITRVCKESGRLGRLPRGLLLLR